MQKTLKRLLYTALVISAITACSKSGTDNNAPYTVESISGTYALKALMINFGGVDYNVFDSLDACEKDNLVKFNTDKTVNFIDAGTVCSPPEDDNDTWDVKGDSIIFQNSGSGKIKSFDGRYLVLSGEDPAYPGVITTSTFEKQ